MAIPKNKTGKYSKNKFEYVNISFSDEEKGHVIAWTETRTIGVADAIMTMADAGYKVSIGLNNWSGMYTCALTCKNVERALYNKCVGYEHTDLERLISIMLFVCTEMLENGDGIINTEKEVNDW